MRWTDEAGFTLVELLVVIAIIGVTIPLHSTLTERIGANEELIQRTLALLVEAQEAYVVEHGRFADNLRELGDSEPELVDEQLATGRTDGYLVELHDVDGDGWTASAAAAAPGLSGRAAYVVDQTGVIRERDCRAGQVWDHREGGCVPDPAAALMPAAEELVGTLDRIGWGLVLSAAAEQVSEEAFVDQVAWRVDVDGDGRVGLDELVVTDPFAIAEDLVDAPEDARATIAGEDRARELVDAHRRWLVAVLQPGIAGEALPDGVPLADRLDGARALLDGVGRIDAATSLRFLGDHVDDLDVTPEPRGDMMHPSARVNAHRRDVLRRDVAHMVRFLDEGRQEALVASLHRVRARGDGTGAPEDWVVGPAAALITAQVDLTLRLLDH